MKKVKESITRADAYRLAQARRAIQCLKNPKLKLKFDEKGHITPTAKDFEWVDKKYEIVEMITTRFV